MQLKVSFILNNRNTKLRDKYHPAQLFNQNSLNNLKFFAQSLVYYYDFSNYTSVVQFTQFFYS